MTINYARFSSHDQKEDLTRQVQVLEAFSATNDQETRAEFSGIFRATSELEI
jgi:predicted site-specific integrase-resolvase